MGYYINAMILYMNMPMKFTPNTSFSAKIKYLQFGKKLKIITQK